MWGCNGGDSQFCWRNNETLINEDLSSRPMVNGHQRQMVVVIRLPEFGGNAQVVKSIVRNELISSNLVPFFSRFNSRRAQRVDAQANGRTPGDGVFHKLHLFAVIGEEKWTRALQALLGHNLLIGLQLKLGADGAIGPNYAHDVRSGLFAQTEMNQRTRDRLFLHQQAGTDFHLPADTE